jgi:BirA family biotin operon repressor/biotin-[acetyl-CoA-carboxylase] ligase
LGKNLIDLPTCSSTNAEAQAYLQTHTDTHIEGTIIITKNQTAGRGQRGNIWEAKSNTNLTFSLILSPKFLTVSEQFKLNIAITVGISDALQNYLPIKIKWSNDIYTENRKLGGILIENTIQQSYINYSIIGIGLNINQLDFSIPIATSLSKETNQEYDLQTILEKVILGIENRYLQLRGGQYEMLKAIYLQRLYWYQELHSFEANNQIFVGMIIGTDIYGRLAINVDDSIRYFDVKEVVFLR